MITDVVINRAIRARKIAAADAPHYRQMFETQPEQAVTLLTGSVAQGGLAAGIVAQRHEPAAAPEQYPAAWVPEVAARESRRQPPGGEYVRGSEPGTVRRVSIEPGTPPGPGIREREPGRSPPNAAIDHRDQAACPARPWSKRCPPRCQQPCAPAVSSPVPPSVAFALAASPSSGRSSSASADLRPSESPLVRRTPLYARQHRFASRFAGAS